MKEAYLATKKEFFFFFWTELYDTSRTVSGVLDSHKSRWADPQHPIGLHHIQFDICLRQQGIKLSKSAADQQSLEGLHPKIKQLHRMQNFCNFSRRNSRLWLVAKRTHLNESPSTMILLPFYIELFV